MKTIREIDLKTFDLLKLAYIGDAIWELEIRKFLLHLNLPMNEFHRAVVDRVNAKAQAELLHQMAETLSEEEKDLVRRTRNISPKVSKRQDQKSYRWSTAFEALIGYWHLTGQSDKISDLISSFKETSSHGKI